MYMVHRDIHTGRELSYGQNGQNSVSTEFTSVAMQYLFPSECMISEVVTSATSHSVCPGISEPWRGSKG
jgi:hypothetical protein